MQLDQHKLKNSDGKTVAEFVNTGTGMLVIGLYNDKFPIALAFVPGEHITEQGQFITARGLASAADGGPTAAMMLTKLADFIAEKMCDRDVQAPVTETMAAARSGYERCLQDVVAILRGEA